MLAVGPAALAVQVQLVAAVPAVPAPITQSRLLHKEAVNKYAAKMGRDISAPVVCAGVGDAQSCFLLALAGQPLVGTVRTVLQSWKII